MIRSGTAVQKAIFAVAVAALAAVTMIILLTSPALADGGVPIPAAAGTEWRIAAGYNTGTHSDADRGDPHAIDIVRTDAPTDWTPVLAPVDGTITWFDNNCLIIRDAKGYAHLLCHLDPATHLAVGLRVEVSDHLGIVFPAGLDANGGLAHIHYAIHATHGGGYLDRSIPFTGLYALEGRELPWRDGFNLHGGEEFISTNSADWSAPAGTASADAIADNNQPATETPTEEATSNEQGDIPVVEPAPVWTMPEDAPVGGWRAVGVQQDASVAGLFANLDAPVSEFVVHNAGRQTYDRFDPNDPGSANVAIRSLKAGQAVWALVHPDAAWLPAPPSKPKQVTIRLSTGANLISWQGPERDVEDALRNVAHLSYAYQYDPYTQKWRFWSADGPAFLNSLTALRSGEALYIVLRVGSVWTQLP